jgi:hypothetical protein
VVLGLSAAQVARRTHTEAERVPSTTKVARSGLATAVLAPRSGLLAARQLHDSSEEAPVVVFHGAPACRARYVDNTDGRCQVWRPRWEGVRSGGRSPAAA